MAALEKAQLQVNRLGQVRDVFIFCCYTGLSYVDVQKLTAKQIVKGHDGEFWINIDRAKTGSASNIPMLSKAMKLIDKYKYQPHILMSGKLLPVISNQRINAYLKELAFSQH